MGLPDIGKVEGCLDVVSKGTTCVVGAPVSASVVIVPGGVGGAKDCLSADRTHQHCSNR